MAKSKGSTSRPRVRRKKGVQMVDVPRAGGKTDVAVIFVDIEDSTGIANHYTTEEYSDFLREFHTMIKNILMEEKWKKLVQPKYHRFMGDEFIAFLPKSIFAEPTKSALELAARLKFEWYFSKCNKQDRLKSDKEPVELNIGINSGEVSVMAYPLPGDSGDSAVTLEGFPITIAKRVQSVGEEGRASRVILADRAFRDYVTQTHREHEFYYIGRRQLKGLSQSIFCYEWLGTEFDFLNFDKKGGVVEATLLKLYSKNPLNPWYAGLLAYYYFDKAEGLWYKGKRENKYYQETANVCLKAIQNITWSNLRSLYALLLTCLDVQKKWDVLGYRAEQAFSNNPTFANALALRAKAFLMQDITSEAHKEADRVNALFKGAKEHEALFIANVVLFIYYANTKNTEDAKKNLLQAIHHAKDGEIKWASEELEAFLLKLDVDSLKDFCISQISKLRSRKDIGS